ncbi:MAG: hypothetical protein EXR76_04705 [Myxococcales bacterium]|nr:hypothetical protein [Myxococcales bacterium]
MLRPLGIALALLLIPLVGAAQTPVDGATKAEAQTLYQDGVTLFKDKQFKAASEKFQAAYNLDPSPILLYNLARAAELVGDPKTAIGHYRAYLAGYPQARDRADVEKQIEVLEAVLGQVATTGAVSITGLPEGASLKIDGATPPAPHQDGKLVLVPGKHVATVVSATGLTSTWAFDLAAGETVSRDLTNLFTETTAPRDDRRRPFRLWGWVGVGVGVAALGGGIFYQVDAFAAADEYNALKKQSQLNKPVPNSEAFVKRKLFDLEDNTNDSTLYSRIFLGVAAVGLLTGATLLVLDASETPATASVLLVPGGLGVVGQF